MIDRQRIDIPVLKGRNRRKGRDGKSEASLKPSKANFIRSEDSRIIPFGLMSCLPDPLQWQCRPMVLQGSCPFSSVEHGSLSFLRGLCLLRPRRKQAAPPAEPAVGVAALIILELS